MLGWCARDLGRSTDFFPHTSAFSIQPAQNPAVTGERQLGYGTKLDVDRCRRVDQRAEPESAVRRLDAEYGNIVGVLVGGIKKISRWVDVHPAGPLTARRLPTDHFEFAGFRLDLEHCHAVVSAARIVEEPAARVDADLRGRIGAGEIGWQCRDRLLPCESGAHRIVIED